MRRRNVPPAYQAALDYLYSFINYENKMPSSPEHARFNLDRMRWLLRELGDPQLAFASVVVAGTKGKGSTCALLESILRAAGHKTGFFSSPHLHSWRERIQVNRTLISQSDVVTYVEQLKPLVARLADQDQPTVFELATALALRYFADQQVDIAVLEVGLGGRYDTVNVATPLVSVITPISFDHMTVLGNTIEQIASAKAGIIKPQVPVVITPQWLAAENVIAAEAAAQGAPLFRAELGGLRRVGGTDTQTIPYPLPIQGEQIGLGGAYQLENARTAVGVVVLLRAHGFLVTEADVLAGLQTASWPGRFEIVAQQPTIVVDGAMNAASAQRLRESLNTLSYQRLVLVLGTSRDKDIAGLARELVPAASAVVLTRSYHPRAADAELLAAHVRPLLASSDVPLIFTDDVPPAIEAARRIAGPNDLICVTGSLFPVAAAREALGVATEID
ncbi:MAG: bifunctional folylpolyglutamate synthase/dihydrofolate synthase [Chloroflexi bacterium]|nr:MAG: bifunctional folylpolyglutamate synthase/dihydrofolate synthase [Chloroflexota bacterium]